MKYDQYISLIRRLETSAAADRKRYEFKVLLLTALGYGYFVGLILLLIAPIVLAIGGIVLVPARFFGALFNLVKFVWILVPALGVYFAFLGSAVSAITAKVPDPEGIEVSKSDAPELYAFVKNTCKELKARKPKKILVFDGFNAAVVSLPRFGIFGRKVVLMVGIPLMKALSPKQFEAVLAHEIGHISDKHGVFAKWAYQMREAWGRLIASQELVEHKLNGLYQTFVDRFFPYFTAYSFVLMREHEKQADREAARLCGNISLGESLILLETKGRQLDDVFWRSVHEENISKDAPAKQLFTRMLGFLAATDPESLRPSLEKAIAVPTDFNDTHPSLAERLRLIGYWDDGDLPRLPDEPTADAASAFLGHIEVKLIEQYDAAWDAEAAGKWKERYDHFQEAQRRINALEEKEGSADLTFEELKEFIGLTVDKDGLAAAMPLVEEAARKFPNEASAWFNLGIGKLSIGDESGLSQLAKAVELDKTFKYEADQAAFDYLRSKGKLDEAGKYAAALEEQNDLYQKANIERANILSSDEFIIHDLPAEFIESIPRKLSGIDEVEALYAVRKVCFFMPEFPFHVLLVELRKKRSGDLAPQRVLEIVTRRLDTGEINWFGLLTADWQRNATEIFHLPGAKIYSRPPQA